MDFPFRLAAFLGAPLDCTGPYVGVIDEAKLRGQRGQELCQVLELLGKASGEAQGLRKPVTTGMPHLPSQRVYLLASGRTALGFLKVGPKHLFVTAPPAKSGGPRCAVVGDALREINPVCALDFYVHESCQRSGYGRKLFDAMLSCEGLRASQLAYDRPSPKLKAFLAKHFGLTRFRPQNNNYVVFDDYFEPPRTGRSSGSGTPTASCAAGPRQAHEPSRPPLPHNYTAAHGSTGLSQSGCTQSQPGLAAPWPPHERSRTPRATPGSSSGNGAGGRMAGPAMTAAGMPSMGSRAGSQRARSTSAVGSSRSCSAGTDPGASTPWGRASNGSAANRFESPLSHAGRSMMMR
mmetsp:Transcript_29927/g.81105  ORF Transcript_29927/g.81105 Transcript_29927/m.81105 type:complete len:349 (-) Transcript_29927:18-1064(-)